MNTQRVEHQIGFDAPLGGNPSTPETPVWYLEPICWGKGRVCNLPGWSLHVRKPDGRNAMWTPTLHKTGAKEPLALIPFGSETAAMDAALTVYKVLAK